MSELSDEQITVTVSLDFRPDELLDFSVTGIHPDNLVAVLESIGTREFMERLADEVEQKVKQRKEQDDDAGA